MNVNDFQKEGNHSYQSRLVNWNIRESSKKRIEAEEITHSSYLPFPPQLVPVLKHAEIVTAGEGMAQYILSQKMLSYHDFTEQLESRAVIPACLEVALDGAGINMSQDMRLDAYKIATEECLHAHDAAKQHHEFEKILGCKSSSSRVPVFLDKLAIVLEKAPVRLRRLIKLQFTTISETLITQSLAQIPKDKRVHPDIRAVVAEHAQDEAKHHYYFSRVMPILWEGVHQSDKEYIGKLFAEFVMMFLEPDILMEISWLTSAGFSSSTASEIVCETHSERTTETLKESAYPTIQALKKAGVMDNSLVEDCFGAHGLIN